MRLALTSALSRSAEQLGLDGGDTLAAMMDRAGAAVLREARILVPDGPWLVLAGPGNNGGDGWVLSRLALEAGVRTGVLSFADPDELPEPARSAATAAIAAGVPWQRPEGILTLERALAATGLVIDALFGVGTRGLLREPYPAVVAAVNDAGVPVLAVDVPTGVDADSGILLPIAIRATATVVLGSMKRGLLQYPAAGEVGVVVLDDIGLPSVGGQPAGSVEVWDADDLASLLVLPEPDAHKGSRGRLLVVAGSAGMTGAAVLAGSAAQRTGVGYVTLALPESLLDIADAAVPSAVTVPLAETHGRALSEEAVHQVLSLAARADAVVLGPGLGREEATWSAIRDIVAACDRPMAIDADALNALADRPAILEQRDTPTVVTPHPGEAGRLLGCDAASVNADRYDSARRLAGHGRAVILKGARSVIAGEARLAVNMTGNPGMATTGTGDVLAGVVGALLAQGLAPYDAAVLGAYLHGRAGDLACARIGPVGLVAGDLVADVPAALRELMGT